MSRPQAAAVGVVPPIRDVAVLCGTHGNEMSGIFLHRFWRTQLGRQELQRDAIRVETTLTNELAVQRCVRYVDVDLNRSYKEENYRLKDATDTTDASDAADAAADDTNGSSPPKRKKTPYEGHRVAELMNLLGGGKTDFAFDLHNTTANTGVMLLIRSFFILLPLINITQLPTRASYF